MLPRFCPSQTKVFGTIGSESSPAWTTFSCLESEPAVTVRVVSREDLPVFGSALKVRRPLPLPCVGVTESQDAPPEIVQLVLDWTEADWEVRAAAVNSTVWGLMVRLVWTSGVPPFLPHPAASRRTVTIRYTVRFIFLNNWQTGVRSGTPARKNNYRAETVRVSSAAL